MTVERVEYGGGNVVVYRADVLDGLKKLASSSVHCIVTSPPYWALRSYLKADDPLKPLEMGGEATPEAYIERMVVAFRECRRVLRKDGVFWLNISDSYGHASCGGGSPVGPRAGRATDKLRRDESNIRGDWANQLQNIPHRLAEALRADGWRWRQTVIWPKAAPMPESVKGWRWERHRVKAENGIDWIPCPGCDKCRPNGGYVLRRGNWRCTTAHEYIFMFVKGDRYFCDGEAVKEPSAEATVSRNNYSRITEDNADEQYAVQHDHETTATGANPRSVWRIKGEPSRFKHYASFPSGLPRRCIQASTSERGCCPKCGTPWSPVVERIGGPPLGDHRKLEGFISEGYCEAHPTGTLCGKSLSDLYKKYGYPEIRIESYRPSCSCPPADPVPCIVLDPFAGTGTTLAVAVELGQHAIGLELNPEYLPMIRERVEGAIEERRIVQGGTPLTGDPAQDVVIEGRRTFF